MPYGEVKLLPGINIERTPTLLEASYFESQLIRFKDSLAQKMGGWTKFYPFAVDGVPRDMLGVQDPAGNDHLYIGTTTQLGSITDGSLSDITPQTKTTNPAVSFTTLIGTSTVNITDTEISNVTVFDAVYINTPVAVGGLIISAGAYAIDQITGATSYDITVPGTATASVSNAGAVPSFATTSGSSLVTVTLVAHGLLADYSTVFSASTTVGGVTIFGQYTVVSAITADTFTILAGNEATSTTSAFMNGGDVQIVYYITLGPPATGEGYGLGAYGAGGYGTGTSQTSQTGTPITATDWTTAQWGKFLLACPEGGGIYAYDALGGTTNAGLIASAPPFSGGIFVSMAQQILVAWATTANADIGSQQDPMSIKWSDVGDFTNFTQTATNQSREFRIPNGSKIMGGMAVANQNLIWTDLDTWGMNYQGLPFVFGFNKVGAGAGLISSHAAQPLRGGVYWMGASNFYSYTGRGVAVIPCPVWDFVFQNMNQSYVQNVRAMPNTPFNEAGWFFPSSDSANGENDSYVKFNITEPGAPWDYGTLARSAWIDQTILGNPIGANPTGIIYQHETGNNDDGAPMSASFRTGYFYIAEGEDFAFVDQILPDFKWGTFGGAQTATVKLTFSVVNFPGDTPNVYGPFSVTQATQFISVRFRGRQMDITVSSTDLDSFWRLGLVRYRWQPAGRR